MDVRFADLKAKDKRANEIVYKSKRWAARGRLKLHHAAMAEQADAADLKSAGSDTVWVRLPLAALRNRSQT